MQRTLLREIQCSGLLIHCANRNSPTCVLVSTAILKRRVRANAGSTITPVTKTYFNAKTMGNQVNPGWSTGSS